MNVLIDNLPKIISGFWLTVQLLVVSGVIATLLGTVLAGMRVSPVPVLQRAGTAYVTVFRNTPLLIVFLIVVTGLPAVGLQYSFFDRAIISLSLYTSAFVCEALRSGINAIQAGQAEASRAIGMTFGQSLRLIVLPQAFRAVVPPLASILIALTKNTAIAEVFGVTEASYQLDSLVRDFPTALWWLFAGIALGYMIIVFVIAGGASLLERRWTVTR
ncbi:ABC transporter permease subunit [Actinopolymorpha rutila]|uniref:Glutamate transport system permease protein n=1 Tax=Actinopolymorpha rutila TaxID=446787 RepID=A0A852ZB22_9ACTN|nr:glutamate transport system permease protein [Actinopolymorpha rutila]